MPSLASVVLLSLALVSPVAAKDCPTEALLSLASNTNLATCQTETGVSVATISALTNAQIAKICKSSACLGLMADVASMHLGDCTIPGSSVTVQTDILDRVTAACGGSSSAASTGSTGSEGSSRSSGATTVGDESSAGSSKSDKVVGGSTTGSSSAATVTVGFVSALALTAVALLV
ncbi:elicitin [Phytophthora cinnamomi]|uniref:elicitin n=1 Tax=Phytophthora cinnamomi TaxID=4785 RepID=UPI0035593F9F|nr:elicitin [Phytophthora cinnamomi]